MTAFSTVCPHACPSACALDVCATTGGRLSVMLPSSDAARLVVRRHARSSDGHQPGVVAVEITWPEDDFIGGRTINLLISDTPATPTVGAVFHDTAVWIPAAERDRRPQHRAPIPEGGAMPLVP